MELRIIRCPACGASLPEVDIERDEVVRCKFCRSDVFIDHGDTELAPIPPMRGTASDDPYEQFMAGLLKGDYYNADEVKKW